MPVSDLTGRCGSKSIPASCAYALGLEVNGRAEGRSSGGVTSCSQLYDLDSVAAG